ncbi:beta-ribofuranosylaminobenzene 5'-phosphate synthase family protein [Plantactinospora sp. WMMB334]|uniref:beta-ribofuranosylaminobenzene 5'-phosphate synthase family protein n=1 Tax=Plantactinospora sp. WMMB334 TaxID=3404119 RepID=UPI003B944749
MRVEVVAPSRVHFGLVWMTDGTPQVYGGAGLTLWHCKTWVEGSRTTSGTVSVTGGSIEARAFVTERLTAAGLVGVRLAIHEAPQDHVGLGSKTTVALACAEAACRLLGRTVTREELVRITGRGGTSGIGVNGYFLGGFLTDRGHPRAAVTALAPSSASQPSASPPVGQRFSWPSAWTVSLVRPPAQQGLHSTAERDFFASQLPLPLGECQQAAVALHQELPAAIVDADFSRLRAALRQSRMVGFKAREVEIQPVSAGLLRWLDKQPEVAATMTSLGPTVVVITRSRRRRLDLPAFTEGWTVARGLVADSGRRITTHPASLR